MTKDEAKNFVVVWQKSSTVKDVCDKLNLTKLEVNARAKALRGKGVELKKYSNRGESLSDSDIDELNKLTK